MFYLFTLNNLISAIQAGFRLGDSCINQLFAITHKIFKLFQKGLKSRQFFKIYQKLLIQNIDKGWQKEQQQFFGVPQESILAPKVFNMDICGVFYRYESWYCKLCFPILK